jgi:hypothetical protein
MEFNPKDAETNTVQLADGIYDAECIDGKEEISKAGNDMMVLNWKVFGQNGESVRVRDYIVSTAPWKAAQAMKSCGMEYDKDAKKVVIEAGDFVGKSARVLIAKDGDYNKIKSYVAAVEKKEINDEIPF